MLSYKKPSFWILGTSLIASVVIAAGFLTDPVSTQASDTEPEEEAEIMDEVLWDEESTEFSDWEIYESDGALSIIGGADGPTSIFLAGKTGGQRRKVTSGDG